jgi:hypothetical protein
MHFIVTRKGLRKMKKVRGEICIAHIIRGFRSYRQAISLLVVVVILAPAVGYLHTTTVEYDVCDGY